MKQRKNIEIKEELTMKEYKAIRVKWDLNLENINQIMYDMSKDGWQVVCMSPEPLNNLMFVVTFSRDVVKSIV